MPKDFTNCFFYGKLKGIENFFDKYKYLSALIHFQEEEK